MEMMNALLGCLCGLDDPRPMLQQPASAIINEKPSRTAPLSVSILNINRTAENVVAIICRAEKSDDILGKQLDDAVASTGWTEWLAENILRKLEAALKGGRETMGPALAEAYENAVRVAKEDFSALFEFVKEHPLEVAAAVLLTIVAFGVLVALAPVVLELLGFGELGPIEGTFAAWWQSTYGAHVPKGALFSYFQRLGIVWGKA